MRYLLFILFAATVGAQDFDTPLGLARLTKPPIDTNAALIVVSTNWLQFGTNLNTGTTATNDLTVWVTNAGTATLTGTASTASPFSVVATASYSVATNTATNVVVRYTRSGEQTDTNELALSGVGGTNFNVHLSGRSTNAPASEGVVGPPVVYMVRTNSSGTDVTAGTQLTNWVDFSTDSNRLGLFLVDWYPNTSSLTNAKIAGTNLTLYTRTNNASPVACEALYLIGPATNYQLCSLAWNGTVNQVNFHSLAVTNATNSGTFQDRANWQYTGNTGLTNEINSATNSLVIGYYVGDLMSGTGGILYADGSTISWRNSGTAQESSAVVTKPGLSTATVTNACSLEAVSGGIGTIFRVEGMRQ